MEDIDTVSAMVKREREENARLKEENGRLKGKIGNLKGKLAESEIKFGFEEDG